MVDILHRVGIKSSLDDAYAALATREGLSDWWADNTQGVSEVGGVREAGARLGQAASPGQRQAGLQRRLVYR
jgi:hypothetical protein